MSALVAVMYKRELIMLQYSFWSSGSLSVGAEYGPDTNQ
jgi:hypothetical protein